MVRFCLEFRASFVEVKNIIRSYLTSAVMQYAYIVEKGESERTRTLLNQAKVEN